MNYKFNLEKSPIDERDWIAENFYSASECGWKNDNLTLSDREWVCIQCGCIHERDHNASVNILREGTSSLNACTNGAICI